MRALVRAELWGSDGFAATPTALRVLYPLIRCEKRETFEGRVVSQRLTVEIPRALYEGIPELGTGPDISVHGDLREVLPGSDLVRLIYSDGDYEEFRVSEAAVSSGGSGGAVLECLGMIYDLSDRERVIFERVNGQVSYTVTKRDTVSNILTFALGFGPSSFSLGDVTPASTTVEVTFNRATPLAAAIAVAEAVADLTGITYEISARRDGSAYKLDLNILNSGAPVAEIRTGKSLRTMRRAHTARDLAGRVVPFGANGRGVGDNAWLVTAVLGSPTSIQVQAPQGGPGPIWLDLPEDGYVVVDPAGGTHTVTAANEFGSGSPSATSTLEMTSTTGIAVGDWVWIVRDTSLNEVEHIDGLGFTALGAPGLVPVVRTLERSIQEHTNWFKNPTFLNWSGSAPSDWTATVGGTNRTTANQGTAKGWTDPDGSSNGLNTGTLDTSTTSFTIAAGSRLYNIIGDPTAGSNVDAADDNYTLQFKITANRGDLLSILGLERTVTATVQIEYSTDGGSNWTTLSGSYQVNSGDTSTTTEFTPTVQVTGSPTQLRFRLILSAVINGGVASGSGSATVQVFANTWLTDTYPVLWVTGGAAPAEDTTAGRWLTGGRSAKFTSGQCFLTQSRSIYFPRTGWVTYTVWIYVQSKGSGGVSTIRFKNPQSGANTDIALDSDSEVETGRFIPISRSFEITSAGQKTIECRVGNSAAANSGTWWVDAAQFAFIPSEADLVVGSGGGRLWQDALRYIVQNYEPIYEYQATLADLTRANPTRWPNDELLLGATAKLTDLEIDDVAEQRIVSLTRDELELARTQVAFANRVPQLSSYLAEVLS